MRAAMQAIFAQHATQHTQHTQQAQPDPAVPTTPVLLGHLQARIHDANDNSYALKLNTTLATVTRSIQAALESLTEQERQALSAQGIALQGRSLTPLLVQGRLRAEQALAGLGAQDMSALNRAQLMAATIREQLAGVPLVNPQGQQVLRRSGDADTPEPRPLNRQRLGQTEVRQGASVYQKTLSSLTSGHLGHLAALTAAHACGLDAAQTTQLHAMTTHYTTHELQRRLHQLGQRHGPQAIALVHQLWDPQWVAAENSKKDAAGQPQTQNSTPSDHRNALLYALMHLPERNAQGQPLMQQLIAAAHDDAAMQALCQKIEDTADPALNHHLSNRLPHALRRLQGLPYEPQRDAPGRGYTGTTAANTARLWLQSKAQQPDVGEFVV